MSALARAVRLSIDAGDFEAAYLLTRRLVQVARISKELRYD